MKSLEEALQAKEAAQLNLFGGNGRAAQFAGSVAQGLRQSGPEIGKNLAGGAAAAAGAAVAAGVSLGVKKLLESGAKRRDFERMMQVNPDLTHAQQDNPSFFNEAYTSLRSVVPEYAKDPIIAGSLMRRMATNPEAAGGILTQSVSSPSSPRSSVALEGGFGPIRVRKDLF